MGHHHTYAQFKQEKRLTRALGYSINFDDYLLFDLQFPRVRETTGHLESILDSSRDPFQASIVSRFRKSCKS